MTSGFPRILSLLALALCSGVPLCHAGWDTPSFDNRFRCHAGGPNALADLFSSGEEKCKSIGGHVSLFLDTLINAWPNDDKFIPVADCICKRDPAPAKPAPQPPPKPKPVVVSPAPAPAPAPLTSFAETPAAHTNVASYDFTVSARGAGSRHDDAVSNALEGARFNCNKSSPGAGLVGYDRSTVHFEETHYVAAVVDVAYCKKKASMGSDGDLDYTVSASGEDWTDVGAFQSALDAGRRTCALRGNFDPYYKEPDVQGEMVGYDANSVTYYENNASYASIDLVYCRLRRTGQQPSHEDGSEPKTVDRGAPSAPGAGGHKAPGFETAVQ